MANTSIDLVGLDFTDLKNNLKSFLKTNTQFKDVDFEGSNMSVLLDLLAYNTYLNGFYTNMVASEMFLDTAQLRDSIVSHAKELNYVPRSFNSSKATITVDITPSTSVSSIVVPRYTSFTSRVGANTYSFTTDESFVLVNSNNNVYTTTLEVYEGIVTSETFIVNQSNTTQRFVLSNPTIDVSSIIMTVYEDSGQTELAYTKATQLFGVSNTSKVFFVQAAENQQYEIVFGDGVYGRKPKDGAAVVIKYRACSGELPNGSLTFVPDGPIDGHTNIVVTTDLIASGGAVGESLTSVRFNAPRSFQAQDRAVTTSDYETLLLNQFADIQALSVYGGEDATPPQYGKVFVSVDVANADGAPMSRKKSYSDFIKDKTPLTINVEFVDPDFMYVEVVSDVQYNVNNTTKTAADIRTAVQAAISSHNNTYLSKFKAYLYLSSLTGDINNADSSIVSNDTSIRIIKRYVPPLNTSHSFVISTDNALKTEPGKKLIISEPHYGHTLTSSTFTYQGTKSIMVDDTLGNVHIAAERNGTIQILGKVGSINYTTGRMVIDAFNVSEYEGNYIEFIFQTASNNITCIKNTIMAIDPRDVTVNVIGVKQ
jgi:hypothetical protein